MNLRFQACVVSSLVVLAATVAFPSRAQGPAPHPEVQAHAAQIGKGMALKSAPRP